MRTLNKILLLTTLMLLHLSCQQREVYLQYKNISDHKWTQEDTLYFQIDSSLIASNYFYDISIELKHNAQYPYQNIWFSVEENILDSLTSESVQYLIADDFGNWEGSGFGSVYQISLPYRQNVKLSDQKTLQFKITHKMRDVYLDGIEDVGLRIIRVE